MKLIKYYILCLSSLVVIQGAAAQAGSASGEWGGLTDIFDFPVGARAMAMGGAYVSVSDDPFALYWNPAALQNLSRKSVGLYYTNLPGQSQYNYLAYAHPTLFVGTFSVGILRLTTGDIDIRGSDDAVKLGTLDYGRTLYLFGYGFRLNDWFALGTTFKVERASFPGYPDAVTSAIGTITETAFGADFGLLLSGPAMKNFVIGLSIQNTLQRSMRVFEERETTPRNFRLGLSRRFALGDNGSALTAAFELDLNGNYFSSSDSENVPPQYHLGMEYSFKNSAMLRMGYDLRNNQVDGYGGHLTYGAGLNVRGIELDYAYWNGWDSVIGSSHRISVILNFGRERQVLLSEYQRREMERIEEEALRQAEKRRHDAIVSGLAQANLYYSRQDYIRAYRAINRVLAWDETGEDPELNEAREIRDQIDEALAQQREAEFAAQIARSERDARLQRQHQLVTEYYNKALTFYEAEEYPQAIDECDRALEVAPESEMVKNLRTKAEEDLKAKILSLFDTVRRLEEQGRQYEAIPYYNQAQRLARGNKEWESYIARKLAELESSLNYENLIRRATEHTRNENWSAAADLYREALKFQPSNTSLRSKYEEANAWANARNMEMPANVKDLYLKGYRAFMNGDYEQAIEFYEQARQQQPLNRTILRALDIAKKQYEKKREASNGQ